MKIFYLLILSFLFIVFGCDPGNADNTDEINDLNKDLGTLDINFVYNVQGIPHDRIRRVDLSLARTSDSLYRGQFFLSRNVSDAITKYRFFLKPGIYYFQATITCLCQNDSCYWAEFPGGQFGMRMDGGKVTIIKEQQTEVTTQFH